MPDDPTKVDETPEEVKETSVKEETPPVKETEEVESTEETPETEETEEVKETEEEFDLEEFKKQTVEETQKAVFEKMMAGLGMTREEKDEAKKELIPEWEKRGETKPKSWKEASEYAADLAEWKRERREEEIKKVQEENEAEAVEVNKKWNDYWDSELKELEESGKIPSVKDENDVNDPGKRARIRLFAKMKELGTERQAKNLPPITSVKLIYYEHYDNEEPPGSDAPISFGKKGVTTDNKDDYDYYQIHNKSVDQIKGR